MREAENQRKSVIKYDPVGTEPVVIRCYLDCADDAQFVSFEPRVTQHQEFMICARKVDPRKNRSEISGVVTQSLMSEMYAN